MAFWNVMSLPDVAALHCASTKTNWLPACPRRLEHWLQIERDRAGTPLFVLAPVSTFVLLLSCLWNATGAAIHQAVCIFCVQQRDFAAFCCLLTRSRKDGEEGTVCHSITCSCGWSRSVNKTANKSATHKACLTSLKELLIAPLSPHFAKTSYNAVI